MSQENNNKYKCQGIQESILVSKLRVYSRIAGGEPENIADIADSISEYGVLTPLIVIGPDDAGMYDILDGDGRYQAVLKINNEDAAQAIKKIPCYVVSDGKNELLIDNLIEQLQLTVKDDVKREVRRFETVKHIYEQCERGEINRSDITQKIKTAFNISDRYARMYKLIYTSDNHELQEAVKCIISKKEQKKILDGGKESARVHIPLKYAAKIAVCPKVVQEEMLRRIYSGENISDVLSQVKKAKDCK